MRTLLRSLILGLGFLLATHSCGQTIRPTNITQLRLGPVTSAQEATMTINDGDYWYNSDLQCYRTRIGGTITCLTTNNLPFVTVGSSNGIVTPPNTAPTTAREGNAGNLPAGNYAVKYSLVAGLPSSPTETTPSPCKDQTLTAGAPGSWLVVTGPNTSNHLQYYTGAWGYYTYVASGTCAANPSNTTFWRQTPKTITLTGAAAGTSMSIVGATGIVRTGGNLVTVTTTATLGSEFAVGRPVVIAGVTDQTLFPDAEGVCRIARINSTTSYSVYWSGHSNGTSGGGTAQVPIAAADGQTVYYRTATPHSLVTGKSVTLAGYTAGGFNMTATVRESIDSTTFTITNALAAGTVASVAGTVAWGTGIDGTSAHHITGSFIVDTLATSGNNPSATNTTVIPPLQVAANATCPTPPAQGCTRILVVPAGITTISATGPIVLHNTQTVIGSSDTNNLSGSTISCTWSHAELPCVIVNGASTFNMEGVSVQSTGHALGIFSTSVGVKIRRAALRTSSTAGLYSSLLIFSGTAQGFSNVFEDITYTGDRADVMVRNSVGSTWRFSGGRWNCNTAVVVLPGSSAFLNEGGADDFDRNLKSVGGSVGWVTIEHGFTEACNGITFNMHNTDLFMKDFFTADQTEIIGVVAPIKISNDAFAVAQAQRLHLEDVTIEAGPFDACLAFTANSVGFDVNNQFERLACPNQAVDINYNNLNVGLHGINGSMLWPGSTSHTVINTGGTSHEFSCFHCGDVATATDDAAHNEINGGQWWHSRSSRAGGFFWYWNSATTLEQYAFNSTTNPGPLTANNKVCDFTWNNGFAQRCFQNDGTLMYQMNMQNGANQFNFHNPASPANNTVTFGKAAKFEAQITSTLAGGTAPFVVTSTTEVANLNVANWHAKTGIDFTAALDFGSIATLSCAELTITATGAAANDAVAPSWPAAIETGLSGMMYVSAVNTVTVRLCNVTVGSIDPASRTYGGRVIH